MAYIYEACDQISDFCHQQLLRKVWRKISWTDGRTDRGKTVYPPPPSGSGGIMIRLTSILTPPPEPIIRLTSILTPPEPLYRLTSILTPQRIDNERSWCIFRFWLGENTKIWRDKSTITHVYNIILFIHKWNILIFWTYNVYYTMCHLIVIWFCIAIKKDKVCHEQGS